jgi:signal transduction histidine kinase
LRGSRQSLRSRLLWPLVAVSILTSIAVAIASYVLASRSAERELASRYRSIALTLESSSFPLTRNVLRSVSTLTETELIVAAFDGTPLESTLKSNDLKQLVTTVNRSKLDGEPGAMLRVKHEGSMYRAGIFRRTQLGAGAGDSGSADAGSSSSGRGRSPAWIIVLIDEAKVRASLTRAVVAPLATGLSTVALLTTITLWLASRLIRRLSRLQKQVNRIAEGEFGATVEPGPPDEVGLLASAVNSMGTQLQQIWKTLNQSQGERMLHQLAAGLAHNLRNSLTGARMAIELHQRQCSQRDDEGLVIALHEIGQTENYVRRLLLVAAGKQEVDKPAKVSDCLQDVRASLESTAKHHSIDLSWHVEPLAGERSVQDGPSLVAALTNLIFNAMHCAKSIEVHAASSGTRSLIFEVVDDGPGPAPEVQATLFDPFVTTKAEGLGLGLPLVQRMAKRLGGDVNWRRSNEHTIFTLTVEVQ